MRRVILMMVLLGCFIFSRALGQQVEGLDSLLMNTALPYYENLYVHTDRSNYQPGDTIFLRGDLFSAVLNRQMLNSRFIYVDLVDTNDAVLHREKIALDTINGSFNGYFPLHKQLKRGEYKLFAYTYFMQNLGKEYFFCKKISLNESQFGNEYMMSDMDDFQLKSSEGHNAVNVEVSLLNRLNIENANVSISVVLTEGNVVDGEFNSNGYKPYTTQELVEMSLLNQNPTYSIELSTVLSGYIITRKGKVLSNVRIGFIGEDNRVYYVLADECGHVECPVEWRNNDRFYTQAYFKSRIQDVILRFDDVKFLTNLDIDSPYKFSGIIQDDGLHWSDDEVRSVTRGRMHPMHTYNSPLYSSGMGEAVSSSTSYVSKGKVNAFGPVSELPDRLVVNSKRKFNIQRVVNGTQANRVQFVYNGGPTCYWNYNAIISKDKPFEFSFPTAGDSRGYTVIVNGVDNNGNPVSGVWTVEN